VPPYWRYFAKYLQYWRCISNKHLKEIRVFAHCNFFWYCNRLCVRQNKWESEWVNDGWSEWVNDGVWVNKFWFSLPVRRKPHPQTSLKDRNFTYMNHWNCVRSHIFVRLDVKTCHCRESPGILDLSDFLIFWRNIRTLKYCEVHTLQHYYWFRRRKNQRMTQVKMFIHF